MLLPVTRQQVDRILKTYPKGRRQPSCWQTVATSRPCTAWAITFYDIWDRQVTCFGIERATEVSWEHREAARYAKADRKPAFKLATVALPEAA